jgi:hypothetical protein
MNMTNGGWYSSQLDEGHKPPQVHVKIEDVGGKLLFTVEVVADEPGEYTADIRGLVFQVADDSVLGSLKISPNGPERYDVTAKAFAAGGTNIFPKKDGLIDPDLNVNGPGNDITWDIAVQIGEPGNDGITRTSFVLESTAGPLSLEDIDDNLYFGVRLKSVTEVGSDQGLSDKILFTSPPYSAPPPAPLKASLGDRLWEDTNNNGKQDDGDTGLDGVTVHLLDEAGHPVLKDGVAITTVTKDGDSTSSRT